MTLKPRRSAETETSEGTNLPSVQSDGGEGEGGDVQGAVLHEAADVAHGPPKHPGAVYEADLTKHTETTAVKSWKLLHVLDERALKKCL